MNDDLIMNRFAIVDHPGVDESVCSNTLSGFGGHTFDHEHVIEPGTEGQWASTILYCRRCGHIREFVLTSD